MAGRKGEAVTRWTGEVKRGAAAGKPFSITADNDGGKPKGTGAGQDMLRAMREMSGFYLPWRGHVAPYDGSAEWIAQALRDLSSSGAVAIRSIDGESPDVQPEYLDEDEDEDTVY